MVTHGKDQGGLGIRTMHSMNLAFLAKLGWRLISEKDWAMALIRKYIRGEITFYKLVRKQNSSNV